MASVVAVGAHGLSMSARVTAARGTAREDPGEHSWGWLPAIFVFLSLGLLLVALANRAGVTSASWGEPVYWIGLLVMFVPVARRTMSRDATRFELYGVVVALGLALFAVKVFASPTVFRLHDELGHWRSVADIMRTGHLFQANPIVRYYPYFPGLDLVTAAIAGIGNVSIFTAGLVVSLISRLVLLLGLMLSFEAIGSYSRVGAIATVLYMANPNFVYFDALFSHETLALALIATIVFVLVRRQSSGEEFKSGESLIAILMVAALVITGHLSAVILCAFLLIWAATMPIALKPADGGRTMLGNPAAPLGIAALGLVISFAWLIRVGTIAVRQLSPIAESAWRAATLVAVGSSPPKELFLSGANTLQPLFERAAGIGSVVLVLTTLAFGVQHILRRQRGRAIALALMAVGLLYPVFQALRFTQAGTEISNRSNEYVFVAVGYLGACFIAGTLRDHVRASRPLSLFKTTVALLAGIMFVGGITIGWAPYARRAGPYMVGAGPRSIGAQNLALARWAALHLPPHQRLLSDETSSLVLAAFAQQDPQGGVIGGHSVWKVFFSDRMGAEERSILAGDKIHYVVVDRRLAQSLPNNGWYFERTEPGAYHHEQPLSAAALDKFDNLAGVDRIFDTRSISIYDVSGIRTGN